MTRLSIRKLKKLFHCKICWQLSLSLFVTILIAEIILLIPFYFSYRNDQLKLFENKQVQIAKVFLDNYLNNTQGIDGQKLLTDLDIKGLTIYDANNIKLKSFGAKQDLGGVDFKNLQQLNMGLYKEDAHYVYTFLNQTALSSPHKIITAISNSYLKDLQYSFLASYWDKALILLFIMMLSSFIITYFWLVRPIRRAYRDLKKTDAKTSELKITHLPKNELGFIFNTTNEVVTKLDRTILKLENKSSVIHKLNESLESMVETRTQQLKQTNQALKTMALLPEENTNPVFRADIHGSILYANQASSPLFKFWKCEKNNTLPCTWAQLIPSILAKNSPEQIEVSVGDATYLLDFIPIKTESYVNIYGLNITKRKLAEQENEYLQSHNQITKLYNKRFFKLLLEEKIIQGPDKTDFNLLFLQINDIMTINQNLGHNVGDAFLQKVSDLLKEQLPINCLLGHFSQNIFALAAFSTTEAGAIDCLAMHLISLFTRPFNINSHSLHSSLNIGIAVFPNDSDSIETLFKYADMALLQANAEGANTFHFFTEDINQKLSSRYQTFQALHDAVHKNQLLLYYQPQLNLKKDEVLGVEALIRWEHPEKGLIPPDDFIDILEKSSLIFEITEWLFSSAAQQHNHWKKLGLGKIKIAVNLTSQQLRQDNLLNIMKNIVETYKINPKYIEIEITERASLNDPYKIIKTLQAIQALGFEIALDDFGTEYSSLTYLQRLPINKLKIDKSFIDFLDTNQDNQKIVSTIIQLAKSLGLKSIAEGVETENQKSLLSQLGCDEIQGYIISKPLSASEILPYLGKV